MAPPETSGSTSARPEYPKVDEAEENNLQNNFTKMIEALEEKMKKNSLKKWRKKTDKNGRNQQIP